jgi:hypothetical protein
MKNSFELKHTHILKRKILFPLVMLRVNKYKMNFNNNRSELITNEISIGRP